MTKVEKRVPHYLAYWMGVASFHSNLYNCCQQKELPSFP